VSLAARSVLLLAFVVFASAGLAEEIVAPATRNVTPPGMMPAPEGEGPLIREPIPPRPPEPARWRRYFLPITTDAATFLVKGQTIRIAGVTPPAIDEICHLADASEWPCGRTALYSLRMFLRGRAVECFFPPAEGATEIIAPCRVGKTDLGLWLLAQGWTRPSDLATSEYLTASVGARCVGAGIWRGSGKPAICP
jgi:endonuclease YncB( thermonuclease family)